ncbi:hypothetical protein RYD26_05150 [Pasteurellaceae bacterium LIM206]|nr:hypothetical protein [Pasteurellaceae bacterium LIM206]
MRDVPSSRTNSTWFADIKLNFIPSFYMNSVASGLTGWEDILWEFNCCIEDEEVWEIARSCEQIPHFGNLYQSLVLGRLESLFYQLTGRQESDDEIRLFIFINGFDTHFCIDGEAVNDLESFLAAVEKFKLTIDTDEGDKSAVVFN